MKNVVLILFLGLFSGLIFAQEKPIKGKARQEKIKQLKIAYITEQLSLTTSEAEKFWPVYNELESKLKSTRKAHKKIMDELSDETMKEDELKKKATTLFENEQTTISLKKEYYTKIAEEIGYKKATKLLQLEKEFKQKLLQELKKRKKGE
jgi:hypothetical protein